ncbi:acyltransferase family protein [Aquipuribacter nitratireducens]|uniref:Acyltransferase family protein n=1 Tax=Aquipuribacter nitratireducens TaxID=650104 RepID=A0ABW0GPK5_9MICO
MDLLRGTAVVLVVVYHAVVLTEMDGVTAPGWVEAANAYLAPFRIPLLVILSGMLLGRALEKPPSRYFSGKLSNIGWPYLVWTAVFAVVTWPVASPFLYARGGTYLWFLLFLLVFFAAAWMLRALPASWVVAVSFALAVLAPTGSKYTERLVYLFALFMLGHLVRSRLAVWRWLTRSRWVVPVGLLLVVVQWVVGSTVVDAADPTSGYGPPTALATLGGLMVGVQLAPVVARMTWTRPLRHVGEASLVYYVSHFPVATVVIGLLVAAGVRNWAVLALVGAVVALGAGAVLARCRATAPVQWLFALPGLVTWARRGASRRTAVGSSGDRDPSGVARR